MPDVEISQSEGVALIRINRPEQKNAFTLELLEEIAAFLEASQRGEDDRVVVLTGAGESFCAGVDLSILKMIREQKDESAALKWKKVLWERVHRVALAMDAYDRPIIAAVNGAAYGAGMDLALMCDMRFAGQRARFCEAYINLGMVPGDGGCFYLPRLVGLGKALELLLGGEPVDAQEARELGIVNRVYADDELLDQTLEFARRLAGKSPVALRMIKRATIQSLRLDLRTSLDLISSHMGIVQTLSDTSEAIAAHRERRPARFEGR